MKKNIASLLLISLILVFGLTAVAKDVGNNRKNCPNHAQMQQKDCPSNKDCPQDPKKCAEYQKKHGSKECPKDPKDCPKPEKCPMQKK